VLLRESEIDLALDSFAKAQALAPNNAEIAAALASTKRLTTRTP
jgi:cytochrome c-type biogenesis protein CcmH/NrfG